MWYLQAEELAPNKLGPKYYIGLVFYLRRNYSTALEYFESALTINPQHVGSAYYMAQCLYRLDRRVEGISRLQTAIDLNPEHPWNWEEQLGDWLVEIGDKKGALERYQKALEWHPERKAIQQKIRYLGQN